MYCIVFLIQINNKLKQIHKNITQIWWTYRMYSIRQLNVAYTDITRVLLCLLRYHSSSQLFANIDVQIFQESSIPIFIYYSPWPQGSASCLYIPVYLAIDRRKGGHLNKGSFTIWHICHLLMPYLTNFRGAIVKRQISESIHYIFWFAKHWICT